MIAEGVRRSWLVLVCVLLVLAGGASSAAANDDPGKVVQLAADELLGLIDEHRAEFDENPDAFYAAVDDSMAEFVDYESFARGVMGRHWADASEAQRERFVRILRRGLVRGYAGAMVGFDLKEVKVQPVRDEHVRGDRAIVRMDVTTVGDQTYTLQYAMARDDDHGWRVRNVEVRGVVDLGRAYRSQFSSAMQSERNIEVVIDNWSTEPLEELEEAAEESGTA